ncbi:hypothetical protein [Alkalihalobacillus sp. AL-G]|uniref:hypothetical protein n=1 Tax=Alkalihalobacillus sp. AL-G TaxID=2926399 RepID=UPI00272C2795|nr:hypothetical protein [Alkalihalobacillus sp. AL-G]WLD94373.1 hypothetical protein MOJ78_05665 [Alkalihalobacillus sp. AL-G]
MLNRMNKAMKWMVALIVLLVIAISVLTYDSYQQMKEEKRHYQTFINNFYFSVQDSQGRIQYLIEETPENASLNHVIRLLENDLLKTHYILKSSDLFLDDLYYSQFFRQTSDLLYGMNFNQNKIPPLGEDGKLDQREINLLRTIENNLEEIKKRMYSPETKQENPDLTLDELNAIIMKYANQIPSDVYREASKSK